MNKELITENGTVLVRQYLYLEQQTWQLIALLSKQMNIPKSQLLHRIVTQAGDEQMNDLSTN